MRSPPRLATPASREAGPEHLDAPVEFVGSFPDLQVALHPPGPEVAFVGRSNVGKSSLLNAITGRPGLARVSGTPGKTTLLNVFRLPGWYLIDLPGYGFARASKATRAGYRRLVDGYLRGRPTLAGVIWLLDIRHDPSADDLEMQRLLIASSRPVLVALTKADKLSRQGALDRARTLATQLDVTEDQIQITSSRTGLGIRDLAASIRAVLEEGQ
jgi:GTP-binding protein